MISQRLISKPLIVLGAPRSGTLMIFQALSTHPSLWSLYRESDEIISAYFPTHMIPGSSDFVGEADVDEATADAIDRQFFENVGNAEASPRGLARHVPIIARYRFSSLLTKLGSDQKSAPLQMIEKTPENCFRIQMLLKVFPDAKFIYIARDPRGSIASIHHGWSKESRFQRFDLPPDFSIRDYQGQSWCFGLPPEWKSLNGCTLMEVCAHQWRLYNEYSHRDLPSDPDRVFQIRYEDIVANPGPILTEVARWAGIDPRPLAKYSERLPIVNTRTKPNPDKWRRVEEEIAQVLPLVADESDRLGYPAF